MQPITSTSSVLSETTCYTMSPAQTKRQYSTAGAPKRSKREALKKLFTIPPSVEQTIQGRIERQNVQRSLMMTRAI